MQQVTVFSPSFRTTVWMHLVAVNKTHEEKSLMATIQESTCCFKQILEIISFKIAAIRPLNSHHTNHRMTNKICKALQQKSVWTAYFSFLSRGIILWIELPWPENLPNTYARHTETLDSCFDLMRFYQQSIPWPSPLDCWLSCRVSALQSMVAKFQIFSQSFKYCKAYEGTTILVYIFLFSSRGIILWIELSRPENPANIDAWHTETLDSYFNFIRSHQQYITYSPICGRWFDLQSWRSQYTLLMRPNKVETAV